VTPRLIPAALFLWPLLSAPLHAEAFESAPRKVGGVSARILVSVGEQPPAPGLAVVRVTAVVRGGAGLEVGGLEIEDRRKVWKARLPLSSWALEGDEVVWAQGVELIQAEAGPQPLPTVHVTFRADPSHGWEEVEWTDLLGELRPGPEPEMPTPTASAGHVILWITLAALLMLWALLAAGAGFWVWRRSRVRSVLALSAEERALRDWQRLQEDEALRADARRFHTALSDLVRRYLAETLGVRAPQQTTPEFLAACRQLPDLSERQRELLTEFCERCDLAKFAPGEESPEACGQSAELAHALISGMEGGS
jgi:hypothetical protein